MSSSMGPLRSGAHQLGERWNTVRCPTVLASSGIACTAVAPVPMIATRRPARSRGSRGQSEVWKHGPPNRSRPADVGHVGIDSAPTAMTRNRADAVEPSSSSMVHSAGVVIPPRRLHPSVERDVAAEVEAVSDVLQVAKRLRLRRECSLQSHSARSSGENE